MFYGSEKAAGVMPSSKQAEIRSLMDLYEMLKRCWCAETCAPRMRENWTAENQTLGQCSVTAFLVQDIFGGKVRGISTENGSVHCYNVIEDQAFDLTDAQFRETELRYQKSDPEQFRENHFQDAEKQQRYQLLKNRLNYVLEGRQTDEKYQEDFGKYEMSFREEDRGKALRILESGEQWSNAEKKQILEELIEKYPKQNDIKASLAMLLFQDGERDRSIEILTDLYRQMPHDLVLRTTLVGFHNIMGHEKEIVSLYQGITDQTELKQFDYHHYALALLMTGKLQEGSRILKHGMDRFAQTLFTESPQDTNNIFRLAIMEDIRTLQNEIRADLLLYKQFLSHYSQDDGMQDVLSDTIVEMSTHLDSKWLRPLFLDFVIFVDQLGILKEEPYCNTIKTAYTSLESWEYHEDPRISDLMEHILSLTQYEAPAEEPSAKEKMFPGKELEHYRYRLTYQCYLCLVWDQFQDEIALLPEVYPKTWETVRNTIETIRNADKEEQFHIWLDELKNLLTIQEQIDLEPQMRIYAQKAAGVRKEQGKVSNGYETYRRSSPKIGPNDPCPCGSGKKYKKCCGKVR